MINQYTLLVFIEILLGIFCLFKTFRLTLTEYLPGEEKVFFRIRETRKYTIHISTYPLATGICFIMNAIIIFNLIR